MNNPNSTTSERLSKLFVESGTPISKLMPHADLKNDLNLDSLDEAELVIRIEKEFNVSITNDEWEKILTYSSLIEFIDNKAHHRRAVRQ